jgi:hypothetical protein
MSFWLFVVYAGFVPLRDTRGIYPVYTGFV